MTTKLSWVLPDSSRCTAEINADTFPRIQLYLSRLEPFKTVPVGLLTSLTSEEARRLAVEIMHAADLLYAKEKCASEAVQVVSDKVEGAPGKA